RDDQTATSLADGSVLIAGGEKDSLQLYSAERFGLAANAEPCPLPGVCASGYCVDAICCDAACGGPFEACTAGAKGSGADGVCGLVAAGTDPRARCQDSGASCGDNGVCDGAGACAKYPVAQGCTLTPCTSGADCASGHCTDGVCCDKACDGRCMT